jgi:hypothetical protein
VEFASDAKKDVALDAPVVRFVAGRILDHSYANLTKLFGAPPCQAALALVFGTLDFRLVGGAKRN